MKNTNNVPRLRFPKFTDDWERRKLSEIALQTYGGGTPKTANENFWKGNIPWIQSSDLIEERLFNVKPRKYISQEAISKSSTKLVPQNSIAIVTRVGVGKLVFMPFSYATSQDFLSLSELKIEPKFAVYALYKMMRLVSNEVQGTSIKGITKDELLAKEILIPDREEQKKIGAYLHNLDQLITLHQRKCDKLEEYKKAMLQKIFSQELRFKREDGTEYSEWEEKKFGTTVLIERGGSPRPIKQYITNGDGYNWVKIGDAPEHGNYITHTEEKIKKSGLNKTRQVFKGDLILSNSMSFGKPYIMAIDGCIHDGWLLIRNNQNIYNLKFLCYLLGTDYMLKQYKSLAGGSTVNNLNKELVSMTTVSVPCLEEQQKIADFLSALDEAISYAKQELDKWKELKKGLLQQMFV